VPPSLGQASPFRPLISNAQMSSKTASPPNPPVRSADRDPPGIRPNRSRAEREPHRRAVPAGW
jgi:hypothetical protein